MLDVAYSFDNVEYEVFFTIAFICIYFVSLIFIAVFLVIKVCQKNKVKENSKKLELVNRLNGKYSFFPIHQKSKLRKNCKSKREYDRTSCENFFYNCVYSERHNYKQLIDNYNQNAYLYNSYYNDFQNIMNTDTVFDLELYDKYKYFQKIEKKICTKRLKKIDSLPSHYVEISYISPKGRNSYRKHQTFNQNDLLRIYQTVCRVNERQNYANYQRSLMSESLRYDILQRDNFRCVLCGASSKEDGVKLEVDHILPVSKGGLSIPSNLRTLCKSCNQGKGAKYNPNGLN